MINMPFVLIDNSNSDQVTFYPKERYSNLFENRNDDDNHINFLEYTPSDSEEEPEDDNLFSITQYINRNNNLDLRYYVKLYMDTTITERRPDTPAVLILDPIPPGYVPSI